MTAHIKMMEAEVAAAATLDFTALQADGGPAALRSLMAQHGFAIVTSVASAEQCQSLEGLWAADLRSVIAAENPEKAEAAGGEDETTGCALANDADIVRHWPLNDAPLGAQFVSDLGLPHGQLAWSVRRDENTRAVFAALHDTAPDELCVGMDCVFFDNRSAPDIPEGQTPEDYRPETRLWPHADVNSLLLKDPTMEIFQGVLYVWPASAETSSTIVWPKSHTKEYPGLIADNGKGAWCHYVPLPRHGFRRFGAGARRVPVPPGAMLLWSSRTIHQGWNDGPRLAVPVSFEPKARRGKQVLERKRRLVRDGMPTTHWASLGEAHKVATKGDRRGGAVPLRHCAHQQAMVPSATDSAETEIDPSIDALL